jgi:hypothetical protein
MFQQRWQSATVVTAAAEKLAQIGESLDIPANEALQAVDRIAAHIGLKPNDIILLHALAAFTEPQDWQPGQRPVVWPTNSELSGITGLSATAVTRHASNLFEACLIGYQHSPGRKRYGRRDESGLIVEAFGFDLSPLVARTAEFEWLKEALDHERNLGECGAEEAVDLAGSILSTLNNAVFHAPNRAFAAMRVRFQNFLAAIPQKKSGCASIGTKFNSFLAGWNGARPVPHQKQNKGSGSKGKSDPASSDQPDPGASAAQSADEIILENRYLNGDGSRYCSLCNGGGAEQPQPVCHEQPRRTTVEPGVIWQLNAGHMTTASVETSFNVRPLAMCPTALKATPDMQADPEVKEPGNLYLQSNGMKVSLTLSNSAGSKPGGAGSRAGPFGLRRSLHDYFLSWRERSGISGSLGKNPGDVTLATGLGLDSH